MAFVRPPLDHRAPGRPVISTMSDAHMSITDAYRAARSHRGTTAGFLFSKHVNDRLGSSLAAFAIRLGIHPSVVTLISLVVAVGSSILIIAEADQARRWWLPGLVACVCWQIAYILDCADGQVARATGKKSDFGARLDALVDFLGYSHYAVICALLTVIARWSHAPIPLIISCAALWPVGQIIFLLARADGNVGHSFYTGTNVFMLLLKTVRDTGFHLFVLGLWLFIDPKSVIYPVVIITVVNGVFLLASIAKEAYLSMRKERGHSATCDPST